MNNLDLLLVNLDDFGAAVVVLKGAIIYHEDNDKGAKNDYFSAHDVARRLGKTLGVAFRTVELKPKDVPEDWNFDDLVKVGSRL